MTRKNVAGARPPGSWMASRTRERALALAALVVFGCGDARDSGPAVEPEVPEADRYGGIAVIGGTEGIDTFNPLVTADELSAEMQRQTVFLTLLRMDESPNPQPNLARSFEINDDSTEVVFHLRQDVRWHDGRPTTASDVEFTFRAVKDPEVAFPNAQWFEGWEGPEVIDRFTIRFAVRPRAALLAGWTRLPILPRHVMGDASAAGLSGHEIGTSPLGNGPFRFAGRDAGGNWTFEANEDFPEGLGGRPYLDRVVYREIPEVSTLMAELRSGGVQFVRLLDPSQVARVRAMPDVSVRELPSRAYGFIAWNGRRRLFQDPELRRALTLGIDRQAIVDAVRYGLGQVANGPVGPWYPAYDPEIPAPPFAPDSAAAALERLGWTDTDGDGVRERDGRPLEFELSSTDTFQDILELVQAQLGRIGVRVTVRTMEGGAFVDAITSPERRFDAFVLEWQPDLEVDDRQLFSCDAVGEPYQFASYCNETLEPILRSIPDARSPEEQTRLIREYTEIVNREVPFTFLYFATDAAAVRAELRGATFDARGDVAPLRGWWLHPDARAGSPASR